MSLLKHYQLCTESLLHHESARALMQRHLPCHQHGQPLCQIELGLHHHKVTLKVSNHGSNKFYSFLGSFPMQPPCETGFASPVQYSWPANLLYSCSNGHNEAICSATTLFSILAWYAFPPIVKLSLSVIEVKNSNSIKYDKIVFQ